MTFDSEAPLTRITGETQRANDALNHYYLMGSGRSFEKLIERYQDVTKSGLDKPPTKRLNTLKEWSVKFQWQARIAAQKEIEDARMLATWEERRLKTREQDWSQSEKLRDIANQILAEAPKFTTAKRQFVPGRDGQPDREIITLALNGQLAIRAIDLAVKLARLAAEMETDKHKVEHSGPGGAPMQFTIDDLTRARQDLKQWKDDDNDSDEASDN